VGRLIRRLPFHRSWDRSSVRDRVTANPYASRGVGCSPEYCVCRSSRLVGLPAPVTSSPFLTAPVRSSRRHRPPYSCEHGFILSWASPPLQSTSHPDPARRPKIARRHVLGFVPHRDTSPQSPLMGRAPKPDHPVPSSAFHTPSTAYSSACLASLFHPAATSRVHTSGVSIRRSAASPHRWSAALLSFVPGNLLQIAPPHQPPDTRLQGFDPSSDFEAARQMD